VPDFVTTARGVLPTGEPYRVARRYDGWTRAYVKIDGVERRRSLSWLKKQLKSGGEK
jgi:hypothetical protein